MLTTADAAARHGHESTAPRPSTASSATNGSIFSQPLSSMPLSILGAVLRKQPASASPTSAPALQPSKKDTPVNSSTPSRAGSVTSLASVECKHRKRAHRPRTTFNLAQPPPLTTPRQKLHLRPKILLQLHQVVHSRRPKPVYEVIPYSLLAPRSARTLAGTFNLKDKLCPSDLLIVKAEEYESKDDDEESDDERWGGRDVVAIICPPKKNEKDSSEKTELLLDNGAVWEVTNLPNGGYEFNYVDDHGLHLRSRWMPKLMHARHTSSTSSTSINQSPALGSDDKKFNFSTISTNSRRHPVIATMTRASIDVLDSYMMPSATSPATPSQHSSGPSTPDATPLPDAGAFADNDAEQLPVTTDDALRRFIVVSGIWVAFSENWSPAYSWTKNTTCLSYPSSLPRPLTPGRTMSSIDLARPASSSSAMNESNKSFPKLIRSSTQRLQRKTSFGSFVGLTSSTRTSPSVSPAPNDRLGRSNSTGRAELRVRKSTSRVRFGLALEDQTLPEAEEERQGRLSTEGLRIKELSLPGAATATISPPAVKIIEPPAESRSPPPTSPKRTKTGSAFAPVKTTGLWDSGVSSGPGLKKRPTSLFVVNQRIEKAKCREERSKVRVTGLEQQQPQQQQQSKEEKKGGRRRSGRIRQVLKVMFTRKEKAEPIAT